MKPIYIFRHLEHEGPGYFADFLEQRNIPYTVICIDKGDAVPENIKNASGLVFMGGNMSVNDPLPWIDQELALIRQAVATDTPVLGHCLGGQLISKALGGKVTANPVKEIGWLDAEQVDNEVADEWFNGLPKRLLLFHWHGETFTIPQGATRILQSAHCANQAFVMNNILALQCHVEMTADMVREWIRSSPDEIANPSTCRDAQVSRESEARGSGCRERPHTVQSADQMTDKLNARISELRKVADILYSRWLCTVTDRCAEMNSG